MKNELTWEYLISILEYDPDTGDFIRRISRQGVKIGDIAGCTKKDGYKQINIEGTSYLIHRLAWFYCFKEWPSLIDHINRNKSDNRLDNLREVSQSLNIHNSSDKSNKSGFRNARKVGNKYQSAIKVNGKSIHLGMFNTAEEASEKAKKYREQLV